MAEFEIKQALNGLYFFHLKASGNNEIILGSELYQSKKGCENGIASVQENAPHDKRYERLYAADGQFYFTLKANNGERIGTSEMYRTSINREAGIALVKSQAPLASVTDCS